MPVNQAKITIPKTTNEMTNNQFINALPTKLLSADNSFTNSLDPDQAQQNVATESGSKLFDTMMIIMKEFFEKVDFEKNQQTTKNACKITQNAKSVNPFSNDSLSRLIQKRLVILHAILSAVLFKLNFSKIPEFLQKYHQSVNQFGSRSAVP